MSKYYVDLHQLEYFGQVFNRFIERTPILIGELNDAALELFKTMVIPESECLDVECYERKLHSLMGEPEDDVTNAVENCLFHCQARISFCCVMTERPDKSSEYSYQPGYYFIIWIRHESELAPSDWVKIEMNKDADIKSYAIASEHIIKVANAVKKVMMCEGGESNNVDSSDSSKPIDVTDSPHSDINAKTELANGIQEEGLQATIHNKPKTRSITQEDLKAKKDELIAKYGKPENRKCQKGWVFSSDYADGDKKAMVALRVARTRSREKKMTFVDGNIEFGWCTTEEKYWIKTGQNSVWYSDDDEK